MWLNRGVDLQAAAARLGVHYQTAYRWVRDGQLPASKVGAAYVLDDAEVDRFKARRERPVPPPERVHVRNWAGQRERLLAALLTGDELGARAVVERLVEGAIDSVELCEELLAPVLVDVGERWARGELSVAEEHRASAICDRILARVAVHPRGRPRGVAVVATAPGEEHGLPATMAAVALRADRWQVHHLATEVPPDDLAGLARSVGARILVLSVALTEQVAPTRALAAELADRTGARVLVGAPGAPLRTLLAAARSADPTP